MKVQDILAVKIMYLKVLNFQETVEKSIKVHIKRVLLLINNYVCYFAGASFEAIVCKKIFCGGKSHSCRRRPIILPASRSFPRSSYLLTWRDDAPPVSVSRSEATGID